MNTFVIPHADRVPWADDPSKHSAAFKIFHYPFMFKVSKMHLMETEELETIGHFTTGNVEHDRILANEEVLVTRTIADMVEFHRAGIPFRLNNPKDGVKIYEYIYQHLQDWKDELTRLPMFKDVPMKDLKAMDEFAKEIYVLARGFVVYRPADGSLASFLSGIAEQRGSAGLSGSSTDSHTAQQEIYASTHQPQSGILSAIYRQHLHR